MAAIPPSRPLSWLYRLAPAAFVLVYAAFTLLVFWQLWTPIDGGRGFWRYDPRHEYWGDLIFQHHTLTQGQLALWNPYDRGGFPLYGDPQPGMLYPPNWLAPIWGAIAGSVPPAAITAKILFHWIFGAVGMHLFLRRLGVREPGCYLGGVLFGWTAPKIRYGGSALNWSLEWIPWVLLAVHWFAEKPTWRRGVVLGTTAAMLLLSGAPAILLYGLVICVPYALYRLGRAWRTWWRPVAVAAAVFVLWLLPLVASNLEQLPESVRERRDLTFVTHSAYSPADFLALVVPRISGENLYYGLFALFCIGVLVASRARGTALVFLCVAAAGVLLALGQHAGVTGAAASALPPFGLFRRAHRYLYITSVCVAVLAGLGLGHLLAIADEERKKILGRRVAWIGGAVSFALGTAYLVSVVVHDKLLAPKNVALGLALASAVVGTWLVRAVILSRGRRQQVYAWIAVVFVALDIWTANAKIIAFGFTPPPRTARDATLERLEDVRMSWRVYDRGFLDFRPGTRLGIRDLGGYEDDPLSLSRYAAFLRRAHRDLRLFGHANVRYYLEGERRPAISPKRSDRFVTLERGVHELPAVAPAVLYVPDPVVVADVDAALTALATIVPGQGAVVEGPAPPRGPDGAAPAAGRLVTLEPNRVVAEIETPGPGLVVIAEAYYPAWQARVNGEPAPILPANAMFRGIPVERAGTHVIEMQLRPLRFWALLPAYLIAWALFIWAVYGLVAWPWARRRAPRSPRSSTPPRSDPTTA